MAERTLVAALVIKAVNQASGQLRQVAGDLKRIQKQSADMREVAAHLAVAGTAMTGAGLGMAYGLTKVVEPAMAVEDALHRIANSLPEHTNKMKDLSAAQQAAEATSNALGISQVGLLKQIYLGTSAGLNMSESIKAMQVASEAAVAANGDLESMQRTLNLAYLNFKDPSLTAAQNIQNLGNIMTTAAEKFDYKDIEELRSQLELATPTALATGTSFKDLVSALADFTRHGLTGSVAGAAFEESLHGVLVMQEKLGIQIARNSQGGLDYVRSIANVRQHFIDLYGSMEKIPVPVLKQLQSSFGIRGIRALLINKDEMLAMRKQLDTGLLTTQAGAAERTNEAVYQIRMLKEAFTNMAADIGTAVLPTLIKVVQHLTPIVHAAAEFAKAHPQWVKMAVVGMAIASALLLIGGALALASASVMGFMTFLPTLMTLNSSLGLGAVAARGFGLAMKVVDGALLANPIALTVMAVLALGYALYKLNPGIFMRLIKSVFLPLKDFGLALLNVAKFIYDLSTGQLGKAFKDAGYNAIKYLAKGIGDGLLLPFRIVSDFAEAIGLYFGVDIWKSVGTAFGEVGRLFSTVFGGAAKEVAAFCSRSSSFLKEWGLTILGFIVAPWALLPYEIYKHWGQIVSTIQSALRAIVTGAGPAFAALVAALKGVFTSVVGAIEHFGTAMFTAGQHLMAELGRGIKEAALAPVHAVESVARGIRRYLPFSPAEVGPLRDLHRVRIVQTIAETMRPAPMVAAMRRVAAATALSIPVALSAAAAPALAMAAPSAAPGHTTVINYAPVINIDAKVAADEAALRRQMGDILREHSHELAQIAAREKAKRARLEF